MYEISIYTSAKKCFAIMLFLLLGLQLAAAQKFTASADKTTMQPGETLTITYSLNDDGDDFKAPKFGDFQVLSGPNTSSSTRFYNGRISRSNSYTFILRATKTGRYIVPPALIWVDGKKLKSNSLQISVVPSSNSSSSNNNAGKDADAGGNAFGKENIFIQAIASKKNVMEGEAVAVSYKIFVRGIDVEGFNLYKNPSYSGFWNEEVELPQDAPFTREEYRGKVYASRVLKKVILYPQKSGALEIEPITLECIARLPADQGIFDDFFNDFPSGNIFRNFESQRILVSSNALKINVQPLPKQNKPANFSGFVGDADLAASINKNTVRANEAITYTLRISGQGNFNNVQPFSLNPDNDAEVFTPETEEHYDKTGSDIAGAKVFKYTIIPHTEGNFFLPPVKFSYFDTKQDKYITLQSNGFNIKVEKASPVAAGNNSVKEAPQEEKNDSFWQEIPVAGWIAIGALPLAALLAFLLLRRKKPQPKHFTEDAYMDESRQKIVKEDISQQLSEAEEWLSRNHLKSFYESLWHAYTGWLQQKTRLPLAELSHENIRAALQKQELPGWETEHILSLLQKLEFARYAPSADQDAHAVFAEIKAVLKG